METGHPVVLKILPRLLLPLSLSRGLISPDDPPPVSKMMAYNDTTQGGPYPGAVR